MFVCVCGVGALGGVGDSQIRYQKKDVQVFRICILSNVFYCRQHGYNRVKELTKMLNSYFLLCV